MLRKAILFLFILVHLAGCSFTAAQITPFPVSGATTPATPSDTIASTLTAVPKSTPEELNILEQCLTITPDIGVLSGKDYGTIVIDREFEKSEIASKLASPYLYDLGNNNKISIDGYDFSVSLDRTKLAYLLHDQDKLIISDKIGKVLAITSTQNDSIIGWENEGLIVESSGNHLFLNPYTGERKVLSEDFPRRYVSDDYFSGIYRDVYFDPTLTKVIYFAKDDKTQEFYFSLWDIQSNKEVVRVPQVGFGDYGFPAVWSLNSEQVIIRVLEGRNQYNLVSIHKNGQVDTIFPKNTGAFSLSPDNNHLAFWLYDEDKKNWSLSSINLKTKDVVDYCIKSKYFPKTPIWSPDSRNLAIEIFSDNAKNTVVLLTDLEKKLAIQIAVDAKPVGWLK